MDQRDRKNIIFFILSYTINNVVSGIVYDTYINYLQEVNPKVAISFWAYYGYATFAGAFLLMLIPRIGYKKMLICSTLICSGAILGVVLIESVAMYSIASGAVLMGIQVHFLILAPYVAAYTDNAGEGKIKWYTRAYYMGYIGYFAATYLGGVLVVKILSIKMGIPYEAAKDTTRYLADATREIRSNYIGSNRELLIGIAVLGLTALIPLLMIDEKRRDYELRGEGYGESIRTKWQQILKIIFKREAIIYLIYWSLISFAMGLFIPYFTVYLNRVVHIDKATSSLIVSISYIAIVIFMFATPVFVRKFGRVGTICLTVLASIPIMIVIGNGRHFGNYAGPVMGIALFMRAGLANLGSPAESALNMSLVSKDLRPVYTSVINFMSGIASIASGYFTGKILFLHLGGYEKAYYIGAILYLVACAVMFFGLRKYNREIEHEE